MKSSQSFLAQPRLRAARNNFSPVPPFPVSVRASRVGDRAAIIYAFLADFGNILKLLKRRTTYGKANRDW
jgi:hypothetical protein